MVRSAVALVAMMLLLAGCGGGGTTRPDDGASGTSCPAGPPRQAWAVEVSGGGHVLWRTPLLAARNASALSPAVRPVLTGTMVVAAQDDAVLGMRSADGRLLWSWGGFLVQSADLGYACAD